jgi:hypothetical protein
MNVPLVHQVAIDFYSCVILLITYSVKMCNIYHIGTSGYYLCQLLTSELLIWFGLDASMVNLAVITLERYVKIVHSTWHKNHFRPWMLYLGCVTAWICGIATNGLQMPLTTGIADGLCLSSVLWPNYGTQVFFGVFYFSIYFVLLLSIFIYCYGRILVTTNGC